MRFILFVIMLMIPLQLLFNNCGELKRKGTSTGTPLIGDLNLLTKPYKKISTNFETTFCTSEFSTYLDNELVSEIKIGPKAVQIENVGSMIAQISLLKGAVNSSELKLSANCSNGSSLIVKNNFGVYELKEELVIRFKGHMDITSLSVAVELGLSSLMNSLQIVKNNNDLKELINTYFGEFSVLNKPLPLNLSNASWAKYNTDGELSYEANNCYFSFKCLVLRVFSGAGSIRFGEIRKFLSEDFSEEWDYDTYNRLTFWIKLPSDYYKGTSGSNNFSVVAHFEKHAETAGTTNPGYYQHHFLASDNGQWQKLTWDTHPSYKVNSSGSIELPNDPNPTSEVGINYFDSITWMRFRQKDNHVKSHPSETLFGGFVLHHETADENIEQVYSPTISYNKDDNSFFVSWMRNKDENDVKHIVRYSFNNIYKTGWDEALDLNNNVIEPMGHQGYNAMEFLTNEIDIGDNKIIYFAIKPENSDRYRQIELTLPE